MKNESILKAELSRRGLTKRQQQVLDLVVLGHGSKEIAAEIGVSEQVAKEHVSALLRRFGVPNRVALAQIGIAMRTFGDIKGDIAWLQYLFRDAPVGIAVVSGPEHVYIVANEAYKRVFTGREVIGKSVADAFADAPRPRFVEVLDKVRANGNAIFELESPTPTEWVNQWLQPIRDETGEVTSILIFVDAATEHTRRINISTQGLAVTPDELEEA